MDEIEKIQKVYEIKCKLSERGVTPSSDDAYIFINAIIGYINLQAYYHDDPEATRLSETAKEYGW